MNPTPARSVITDFTVCTEDGFIVVQVYGLGAPEDGEYVPDRYDVEHEHPDPRERENPKEVVEDDIDAAIATVESLHDAAHELMDLARKLTLRAEGILDDYSDHNPESPKARRSDEKDLNDGPYAIFRFDYHAQTYDLRWRYGAVDDMETARDIPQWSFCLSVVPDDDENIPDGDEGYADYRFHRLPEDDNTESVAEAISTAADYIAAMRFLTDDMEAVKV